MSNNRIRFFSPLLYFLVIGGTAAFIIWYATTSLPSTEVMILGDLPVSTFILILLLASIPILFIEYKLFAVPLAALFLLVNRFVKAASYEVNIMNIGRVFSGRHMIRRAAAPALFSIASSDMLRGLIVRFVYPSVTDISQLPIGGLRYMTLSLMGALLFMPIALLIFMPTWLLNDSGIVTHLRENKLTIRQCPDTQGVGRWLSGIFGGYALIAFPLTMFQNHLLPHLVAGTLFEESNFINSLLLIAGLPLFVMAFIIPVILFNERSQSQIRRKMAAIATKMGATIVRKERIEKAQRITREGILTEEGGREIISTAKTVPVSRIEPEIVTSRKAIKKDSKQKSKKKDSSKKKKK